VAELLEHSQEGYSDQEASGDFVDEEGHKPASEHERRSAWGTEAAP